VVERQNKKKDGQTPVNNRIDGYVRHRKKKWEEEMEGATNPGHHAYAANQARIWSQFQKHAKNEFGGIEGILGN
jgi:hypothetical protein